MDIITELCVAWPANNFWATIIKIFDVGSYAWTIILFTIVLKLILSPLDFFQRFYTNKTTKAQAKLQPELEKLKKRYGQNQVLLSQKQTELYKKNNVSMKGSCIVMIIYMVVTLVVFLTLFNSLKVISSFKINNQFEQLQETYHQTYDVEFNNYLKNDLGLNDSQINDNNLTPYSSYFLLKDYENLTEEEQTKLNLIISKYSTTEEQAKVEIKNKMNYFVEISQNNVVEKYQEIKDSWLWVKNIWRSDKSTVTAILNYDNFVAETSSTVEKEEYNIVMNKIINDEKINSVNGFYILSIVVVLVSLLSQYLTKKLTQPKNMGATQTGGMSKILMLILPLTMLIFTLNSSAMFSIYMITNTLMGTILTPLTTNICNKIENKKEEERINKNKANYSR